MGYNGERNLSPYHKMKNTFEASQNLYTLDKNTNQYIEGEVDPRIPIVSKWMGSNNKILDAGGYDGRYAEEFKAGNNTVYVMDASKDAIALAKKRGMDAVVADLENKFPYK